jgi:hypothetical protein
MYKLRENSALYQSSTGFTGPRRDEAAPGDAAANLPTRYVRFSGR